MSGPADYTRNARLGSARDILSIAEEMAAPRNACVLTCAPNEEPCSGRGAFSDFIDRPRLENLVALWVGEHAIAVSAGYAAQNRC